MSHQRVSLIVIVLLGSVHSSPVFGESGGTSRSILLSLDMLDIAKQQWLDGDPQVTQDIEKLITKANGKMRVGPYSVVFSNPVAPSGDIHDYVSYAAYWWPNPDTPDGIPFVHRDGHIYPGSVVDNQNLCAMGWATEALSLGYYFTGDEKYAMRSAELLRTWFLDEETYMNPKNEYGALKPRSDGSFFSGSYVVANIGNCIPSAIDAAAMLESSEHWTAEDAEGLKQWTRDFVHWADNSPHGEKQFSQPANHGTNFDFVKALFSIYNGDLDLAKDSMEHYLVNRMPEQVDADGSNPAEMERANNFLYHRYNLGRAFDLAWLSRSIEDVDMFAYETEDGRSLRLALEYLIPYFLGKPWDQYPGEKFRRENWAYYELLRKAAIYYQDPTLLDAADSMGKVTSGYINFAYPRAAVQEDLIGDFDVDGQLSVQDVDLMTQRIHARQFFARYDLDGSGKVDFADREIWVEDIVGTAFGDTNLDGLFSTGDLVQVMAAAKYGRGTRAAATWAEGDWNGDLAFNETDLVLAFQSGQYEVGRRPRQVPEPAGAVLFGIGLLLLSRRFAAAV